MRLSIAEARRLGLLPPKASVKKGRKAPKSPSAASAKVRANQAASAARATAFAAVCVKAGLPEPQLEFRFHPKRRWRFDFLFSDWLALEIEGGAWNRGAHCRGKHFLADMEKYNEAALLGYIVVRCTPEQIDNGKALAFIGKFLDKKTGGDGQVLKR
jgi:hypothetical protein